MSALKVHAPDGTVHSGAALLTLEEGKTYTLEHPGAVQMWLSERPLRREGLGWVLPIDQWAGSVVLRILDGDTESQIPCEVLPRPEKLDALAWQAMLSDLEQWASGISHGFAGGRGAGVAFGTPLTILTEALLPLIGLFVRNLMEISADPVKRTRERLQHVRFHRVRAISGELVTWLGSNPSVAQLLNPDRYPESTGAVSPYIPEHHGYESLDHAANRYILWLCHQTMRRLQACGELWRRHAAEPGDRAEWAIARAAACDGASQQISRAIKGSFFGSLQPAPASEDVQLVLADHPAYARFHRLARLLLSPMFDASAGASVPLRETYSLYELWCFLEVRRQLGVALKDASWRAVDTHRLLDPAETKTKIAYHATLTNGRELTVEFNAIFLSFWARGKNHRWSLSRERRPDIVVSARGGKSPPSWLFLDAKYRVQRDYLGDAFESIHIYRDSLRDDVHGGTCVGGALLAPRQLQETQSWFTEDFRAMHGCGIFATTPGRSTQEVAEWIVHQLRAS